MSFDEQLRALGRAVAERRTGLGLSQAGAARRWRVDRSWLSDVERGRANPSFESLHALAQAMGISLPDLFRRADELRADQ
jgi:transcriptional regulator with XRE-family HTH domain